MARQNRILFLHVPKTAGSSLTASNLKIDKIIHPLVSLKGAWPEVKDLIKNHYTIAFVRNPWDRFVSLYHYFFNMSPTHFAYKYDHQTVTNVQRFKTFEDFCINFEDFDQKQPFKKFHFFNQHLWTHHKGVTFVDFLGKYENLNEEIKKLEVQLDNKPINLPHVNKGMHQHYTSYYGQTTKDIVAEIYREDINLYGYQF